MKKIYILILFVSYLGYSQVGVGTTIPDATLDIVATNPTGASTAVDGILIPRVDRQRAQGMTGTITSTMIFVNSIATGTAAGTAINITSTGFYYYDGTVWQKIATGSNTDWALTGNSGTTAGTNYLGTNDVQDLVIKTSAVISTPVEKMRVTTAGNVGINASAPTATALLTINPNTNAIRSGIDMTMTNATSAATGLNITTGNSFVNGITVTHSSAALASSLYGIGGVLSSTNIVSGYNGYRSGSGLSYGLYGINGTNGAYATNASTWAGFLQGRTVISSEAAPTSPLGTDLEVRNTTTGAAAPATVSLRQTTALATSGNVLANLNIGDNYITTPQAQIQVLRDAAASSAADMPTAMTFSTTPDASATLTERVRIDSNGNVGIATLPTASSILDMSSVTTKAMEAPNVALTATTTATIAAPATGALIYNTATAGAGATAVSPGYYYWNGAKWVAFTGGGGNDWSLTGNAGTSSATNYVGTSDAVDFRLATNATERMRILTGTGQVIIPGTSTSPFATDRFSVYNTAAGAATDAAINGYSSSSGFGMYGSNTGSGYGIFGQNSSTGISVRGNSTGTGSGVYGNTAGTAGAGVFGVANLASGAGVYGTSNGSTGTGVWGNSTGATGDAVYGSASGTNSAGIYGNNTAAATGYGVLGAAVGTSGYGVYGFENQALRPGVYGINDNATGYGVYGTSVGTSGIGVYGTSTGTSGYGVYGIETQANRPGVYGVNDNATGNGVQGTSAGTTGYGVYGSSTGTSGVGVYGTENQAARYGVWGTNNNATGFGVVGTTSGATATGVNGTTTGSDATAVVGISSGTNADGVYGQGSGATAYGVWGLNNNATGNGTVGNSSGSLGNGVLGVATGATGYGVYGSATGATGYGVYGINDNATGYAVVGSTAGATGRGVYGTTTGSDATAVYAMSTGTNADGVYGQASGATAYGIWGVNNNASGVGTVGNSSGTNGLGVYGVATGTNGVGVAADATTSTNGAISGRNLDAAGTGIIASGNNTGGVYLTGGSGGAFNGNPFGSVAWGRNAATGIGVAGSGNGQAITTLGTTGAGGAFTGNQWALTGVATITGAANDGTDRGVLIGNYVSSGSTIDNVYVGAQIGGVNYKILGTGGGSVSTTMKTSQGERILFAPEATENWFFDMGEVELINGRATVNLDPVFVETLSDSKPFKVFVQGGENTLGSIRITRNQTDKTFIVEDLGGASNGTVQYSVYGIWKGKENLRLPELKDEDKPKQVVIQSNHLNNDSTNSVVEKPQAKMTEKAKALPAKAKTIEQTKQIDLAAAETQKRVEKTEPARVEPARSSEENTRSKDKAAKKEAEEVTQKK